MSGHDPRAVGCAFVPRQRCRGEAPLASPAVVWVALGRARRRAYHLDCEPNAERAARG